MAQFNGLDDFRAQLEAAGWLIQADSFKSAHNECDWLAWTRDRGDLAPDCACNDKPPSLIVHPYTATFRGDTHTGVEIVLTGESPAGGWLQFRAYSVTPAEFFDRLPLIRKQLQAAWAAAASIEA